MFRRNIKLADGKQEDYNENSVNDVKLECALVGPYHCGTRTQGWPELSVEQHRQVGCVGIKDCRPRGKEVGHGLIGGVSA